MPLELRDFSGAEKAGACAGKRRSIIRTLCAAFVALILAGHAWGQSLTLDEARNLVENTRDFVAAAESNRCPKTELMWSDESTAVFEARSFCPAGGNGLLGQYTVDRQTAEVWLGVDRDERVESDGLRRLQEKLRPKRVASYSIQVNVT